MNVDANTPRPDPGAPVRQSVARRWKRWPIAVAAVALLAAACSSGPGTQEEFIEVLVRGDAFTSEEATCIAEAVFDEYEQDPDALGKISAAPDYEYLSSDEGVPGFTEFFESSITACLPVGPTTG